MSNQKSKEFIIRLPMSTYLAVKNPTQRAVFLAVYSFTDNGIGECYATQRKIAERSGLTQPTVKKYLPKLVSDGLLKEIGRLSVRGGYVKRYKVSDSVTIAKELESDKLSTKAIEPFAKAIEKPPIETVKEKQLKKHSKEKEAFKKSDRDDITKPTLPKDSWQAVNTTEIDPEVSRRGLEALQEKVKNLKGGSRAV